MPKLNKVQRAEKMLDEAVALMESTDLSVAEIAALIHGKAYALVRDAVGPAHAVRWSRALADSAEEVENEPDQVRH